jgi:hypothetical protein
MLEANDEDIVIRFFGYIHSVNYPLFHEEIQGLATVQGVDEYLWVSLINSFHEAVTETKKVTSFAII